MFLESNELYDAIYHFKNYARECEILRAVISVAAPGARTVLDVACGAGEHDSLKDHYAVDGVDINENYLHRARAKNPAGRYTRADMTDFRFRDDLRRGDVPVQRDRLRAHSRPACDRAVACMARHVKPGGALSSSRAIG